MRKIATLLPALILLSVLALGQTRLITGTVTDNNGVPVPFASINIKGTTKGTTADENGNFKLEAASGQVLVITAIGVKAKEITIGTTDSYTVTVEAVSALDEVVVTALNIRRDKRSVSYSAQTVDGEKLTISRETNIASAIAGKVAGVQVVGTPSIGFGAPNVRIRGVNTVDGGDIRGDVNTARTNPVGPLYVVDGTPVDSRAVNMDNVENISVLKGAAATALYGQRAVYGILEAAAGGVANAAVSFLGDALREQTSPSYIYTYAQVLFSLAEAAHLGWIPGGEAAAAGYYNDAIEASWEQWGVDDAAALATYIAQPSVAYTPATAMEKFGTRKWIALYLNGYEAWAEWRRIGCPVLSLQPAFLFF